MTREEYIDKLVAFARLKWNIDKATEGEMRLVLEMMPDRTDGCGNNCPFQNNDKNPEKRTPQKTRPYYDDIVLMYGCPIPAPHDTLPYNEIKDFYVKLKMDDNSSITGAGTISGNYDLSVTSHTGKLGEDLFYTNDTTEEK